MFEEKIGHVSIEQTSKEQRLESVETTKGRPTIGVLLWRNAMIWGSVVVSVVCIYGLVRLIF